MMTDPISDLLTRIRNATKSKQRKVDVPPSQTKISIVEILRKEGFIKNYKLYQQDEKGILRIYLKYVGKNRPVIQGLKRISRPSRRVYTGWEEIPTILDGMGIAIVSTSKGMLSDNVARENKIGGELICSVW